MKIGAAHRHLHKLYKVISYCLILSILLGTNTMQTAAGNMADASVVFNGNSENSENSLENDSSIPADNPGSVSGNDMGVGSDDPSGSDTTLPDEEDPADTTGDDKETDDADGDDMTDPTENDNDTGVTEDGNDTDLTEDTDTEGITEELSEEETSLETENEADTAEEAAIAEAEEAFRQLAVTKNLMALIYLTDAYAVRSQPDEKSAIVATLESGHTVYLHDIAILENEIWYLASFWASGAEMEGYIAQKYLAYADEDWRAWEETYLAKLISNRDSSSFSANRISAYSASYADVAQFPAGYQSALSKLKAAHPNWIFVPMNTKLDFNTVVNNEMGEKSLIQNTTSNAQKGWVGDPCPSESGWYYAKKEAVAYYINPCNFLTETYIFQFEQLTYNSSYHTVDAIQSFLASTFMKGALPGDSKNRTYAQAFHEIGSSRKLSPIHLASRVYQEQGQGTSGLISGTYPGYEGYYNYFNVGVNGSSTEEKIKKGLTYAKEKGWNTRYKSLEGGAATIGNNYILLGQDTIYLEKFNVNPDSPKGLYNHQYMQNIQAPASESSTSMKMYKNAGSLNSAFVFKIPVFNNMPGLKLNKTSASMNKGDTLTLTASVNGTTLNGNDVAWSSSAPSIVKVEAAAEGGKITALDAGTAVITATHDEQEVSCTITVTIPLKQITLNMETVTLRRPDTVVVEEDASHLSDEEKKTNTSTTTLEVLFDPADTTSDRTITWSSSNNKVATVKDGVVTAVGTGQATITAKASKAGNKTAKCIVTVIAPVYQIEFPTENNPDTLFVGQSINLSAEYYPKDTTSDTTVIWESSDTSVATVSKTSGSVSGKSEGTAVITASIGGYHDTHTVTVESCTVIFKDRSGDSSKDKKISAAYGATIPAEEFPLRSGTGEDADSENSLADEIFIGYYTDKDGAGSLFTDETPLYRKETVLYPYYEQQGQGFYAIPVGDQIYTGSAIKPVVQVFDSVSYEDMESGKTYKVQTPLVLNKDYTVSYKNNKSVNKEGAKVPTITIKGKGNYTGAQTLTFNILPKPLTDSDITADSITTAYTGKTIKSSPVVYRSGKKLKKNTDYTLTYPQTGTGAYQKAGTYPIIVTGKGGYGGSFTVYETITSKVFLSKVSIAKIPNQRYDAEQINQDTGVGMEPELTVTYKKKPLQKSTDGGQSGDYVVSYRNNLAIGTATATITAVEGSDFTGSKSITFKITGASLAKAVIGGIESKTYTGREEDVKQQNLSLTLNGVVLTGIEDTGETPPATTEVIAADGTKTSKPVDYVISYTKINKAGTATVTMKGVNQYSGTKKKTFKINAADFGQAAPSDISLRYYDSVEDYKSDSAETEAKPAASLEAITVPYMKGGTKPIVSSILYQGNELHYQTDYTISYKYNNTTTAQVNTEGVENPKLPLITIKGKGSYKGTLTGVFTITDGRLPDTAKIQMSAKDILYKAKPGAYKTSVTLTDKNGKKLQAGKDYDKMLHYTYENQTALYGADGSPLLDEDGNPIIRKTGEKIQETDIPNVGAAIRVSVTGLGAYAGEGSSGIQSVVYHIMAADISKAKVKQTATKIYDNGRAVTLSGNDITVTLNGQTLEEGKDYIIITDSYVGNTKKGKAAVTLKGTGANYGGTKKINFTISGKGLVWWKSI
ncbi:MAG: Ig-like domain-containing protein [Blautia sp.]|nr:Ig-like domain-containing protein [Lachnoclostridium sp.]MCM1211137.1 Ig-like domain-containing protein [Blautia sp.]